MKKQLFILTLLCFSLVIHGQDSSVAVSENMYAHFDFGIGYLRTDLGSVNNSLKSLGYKPLKEDFATYSISVGYSFSRLMVRNEMTILIPNTVDQPGNIKNHFSGYKIGVGIGYAIIHKPAFRLFPFAGVNIYTAKLKIQDNTPMNNMDEVVNMPHNTAEINFSNATLDFGVQIDKKKEQKQRTWDCPQNARFRHLGLRLGYNVEIGKIKGKYNSGQRISDAPFYSMNGPYIKLVIGFGTKIRNLKWKK